ncbi:MAG TPA: ABC transporter permease [Thermoanaerobaculia bacterium]|nr:ABC transporter permease [Thermoanaerobaculia bacterium]
MHLVQDLRHTFRRWALRPGFAAAALVTIALGIGATTALFSVVRAVLWRPLPYADPERVVVLWSPAFPDEDTWLSWREIVEYRQAASSFAHLGAASDFAVNLTGDGEPERVAAAAATADAFTALGSPPLLGRTFTAAEDAAGGDQVVLLGYGLWRRRFGGDREIVGRAVRVNGEPHTVVGVMPPAFHLPLAFREEQPPELWVPLALGPDDLESWGDRYLHGFGRLRADVTAEEASRELERIGREWVAAGHVHDQRDRRFERAAVPVTDLVTRRVRPALRVLMGTVACILLIACVNVTNLLLVAAEGRRREVGVAVALGAARRRLVAQLLTESLLLAGAGGALGLALAHAATRLLVALAPAGIPRIETAALDAQTLLFAGAAVLAAGLLFGLAPALQLSRPDLAGVLQEGGRAATPGRRRQRVRRALVVVETALSVALLIGAGLLLRSLWRLRQVDLGLEPARVLTAQLSLPEATYPEGERIAGFYDRLVAEVEALPEVESAAAVRLLPLTGEIGDWSITLEGRPHDPRENPNGDWQVATPGYFETMGIRLVRGRLLADRDRAGVPFAAVVNRTMATRYWPGEALGRRFRLGTAPDRPWFTIVGVVADVHHNGVVEGPRAEMVLPLAQFQVATGSLRRSMTLVAKSRAEPAALAASLRAVVRRLDPQLPVARVRTMEEVVGAALAQPRFTALLLALFAALALALAAVGLYGVIAYGVAARTHEIGIRLTLGSTRYGVLRLVLSEGMAMAAAGIGIGLALGRLLNRFLAGQIYGVTVDDPATFVAVPVLLAAVALAATWLPARRAAALDPAAALRGG